jgi:hypothetical protein
MQWRLRRFWGRRGRHYVRVMSVLRGARAGRIRVPVRYRRQVPQDLESELIREDLWDCIPAVKSTLLYELKSSVVSAPHSFRGNLPAELGPYV